MSELFEHLCAMSPLNLPDNMREPWHPGIAECQDCDPLAGLHFGAPSKPKKGFSYHPDGYIVLTPEQIESIRERERTSKLLTEDTCLSFEEWADSGYSILKGSKSVFKDALGVPQFTIEQVIERRTFRRRWN